MFLGLGGGRDRDQNVGTCWQMLEMGFKILFVTEMILCLLSLFLPGIFLYFPNIVIYTVEQFQLWRLITSFLLPGIGGAFSFINVLFDFYILYMFMPDLEKRFSTAYILLQSLMQIFLCNVVLVIVGYPLLYMGIASPLSLISYGVLPLVFIYLWRKVAESPEEPTRFCCFPCLIPMKYIPVCFLLLFTIFGGPILPVATYCAVGFYQTMVRKQSLLQLPLKVYRKFDSLMPASIKEKNGYIKVASVESNLRGVCRDSCCNWGGDGEERNPFSGNNNGEERVQPRSPPAHKSSVQVMGGGVAIGGNHSAPQNDYRAFWKQRYIDEQNTGREADEVRERPKLDNDEEYYPHQQNEPNSKKPKKRQADMEPIANDEASMVSQKPLRDYKNDSLV